ASAAAPSSAAEPAAKVSKLPPDLPPGFKPTRIRGELFYCRKMVVLGSRFPKQLCLNEDQLKEHIARQEAMKRNKDEVSRLCTTKEGRSWDGPRKGAFRGGCCRESSVAGGSLNRRSLQIQPQFMPSSSRSTPRLCKEAG